MAIDAFANRFVCDLHAYEPGKPIEETAAEMGLDPTQIVKLASNENPIGPSPKALEAMRDALNRAHLYPDGGGLRLRQAIAERQNLDLDQVILGNGSNEIIEFLCHAFLNPQSRLIAAENAFLVYKLMATLFGAKYTEVPAKNFTHDLAAMADAITDDTRLVFIANPNNPTGTMVDQAALDAFVERVPEHVVVCLDEAYFEFLDTPPDTLKYVHEGRNVCVLRTCSKIHGLAGLRIGYGLAAKPVAAIIQKARQPFNANAIAQAGALAALEDAAHVEKTRQINRDGLAFWQAALTDRKLTFIPSHANFIMVHVRDGDRVFQSMLRHGVIVRSLKSYQLPEWIRISVGTAEQNQRALRALDLVLHEEV